MALINTTTTGVLGSTFFGDGIGSLTVQQNGVTQGIYGNIPAFSAYASAQSSAITSATDTKVLFDIETFDTNNNFASSRFTPTIAGYYQINVQVNNDSGLTALTAYIYQNGGAGSAAGSASNATTYISTGSVILYCNGSTDYIELFATHAHGSTQPMTGSISACLIRSA